MAFKINIGTKEGKTFKLETTAEALIGKELNDIVKGNEILPELEGYELLITGTSDNAGFMGSEKIEGIGLGKLLLPLGKGMHKKPRGEKKKNKKPSKGLRLRKTVRGKIISSVISQINMKVVKEGSKKLSEIFKPEEAPAEPAA